MLADIEDAVSNMSGSPWLRDAFQKHLASPILEIISNPRDSITLGSLWIGLAQFLLALYVTNIPIDPAVRRILLGEVTATRISLLEEELAAVEMGESTVKGTSESKRTADIRQRLQLVISEQEALRPTSARPTDASRLTVLFNEVHSFLDDAFDHQKTSRLVESLRNGNTQSLHREDGFQAITDAFVHRLKLNYGDLDDLVRPISTAILFAKHGFRCLARDLELRNSQPTPTIRSMLSFPATSDMAVQSSGPSSKDVLGQILVAASAANYLKRSTQRLSILPVFISQLNTLYDTWSVIRLREQQEAQEADSLYRVKKTDIEVLSDHEQEEKEFSELFPSYDGVSDEDANQAVKETQSAQDNAKFLPPRILAFHRLLMGAISTTSRETAETYSQTVDEILNHSFSPSEYDESLDRRSLAFQIHSLHRYKLAKAACGVHPNFYLSPNEPEIRKVYELVTRLGSRLDTLIYEWPEQVVLQHIRDRCDRVFALDTRSPVAKVLSALEQLLVHTNDWEGYANRENSLKGFQNEASSLIVEWRRLELSSWMRLLDDQAEQYVDADAEWTLRLWGALIHGGINAGDIEEHVRSVLPMLNTYLHTSTVGHFGSRLDTLTGFEKLSKEVCSLSSQPALGRVTIMLHNIIANAQLFSHRITDSLRTQRAVLDKSIRDFVKLASWKDVNVFALKASAVKSHRHLHRSIRKFRDILQQPIAPILADLNSLCPQESPQASPVPASPMMTVNPPPMTAIQARTEAGVFLPDHLSRLDMTFTKLHILLNHSVTTWTTRDVVSDEMDSMAVEIVETAAMLAKATPSTLTKDNTKVVNNLASRKRKAFADLLKALRASGFSQSVRADVLERQQSSLWLNSRPSLLLNGHNDALDVEMLEKVEGYHHRQNVLMMTLRAAFNGHNPDIASQDLQRGIGFVESVYAAAISSRDR